MKPIASFPAETARRIVCILTDIDDTLTTDGQLPAASYAALEKLQGAGLAVVPVTGRPAGWCDMIARFWPVDGVIGENGAFYFRHDPVARKMVRKFIASEPERAANRRRLLALGERILSEVPGAAISADQLYREADLAIDVCEDVPPLPRAAVDRIVGLFESAGGIAKVSSIHVNGWFGSYDKLAMTRIFLRERLGLDLDAARDRIVFCGDSPNDAPMFGFFPYACGVANVRDFEGEMPATPAFIASKRGGAGFVEIVEQILSARTGA
ncbi:HAD hydrolase family protein [Bradyrhizobium septentrionale]|uniref:HAD hydrolase family protein n=1 Tax=Bradyrhizobium septentrionale TaxID=1404411 RepID=A0ABZ2NRY6_9BRAD|nr:HAD hydrolase family protein [Bradyrhizobium septentrionale]UGY22109.1 HAD hydrolase family protein [Bradyrhizobium septentrionale]